METQRQSPGDRVEISTRSVRKFRQLAELHPHYYVSSTFLKAVTMKAYYSRSPVWTALFVVAASSFVDNCEARTWIDVVNPSVFMTSNLDVYRMEFFLEEDPLAFPSSAPTSEPTGSSDPDDNALDDGAASSSPSASPTARYDNVKGYGGCPMGEYLYELEMLDSWGDGWGDSVIKVTQMAMEEAGEGAIFTPAVNIFEGGLATGREGYSYLCLEPFKCYTVDIDSSLWGEEIKWEIRAVPLGHSQEERENMGGHSVAKGLAPTSCQFSIPDEVTGEMECPFICDSESATSSAAPSTASPSSSAPLPASASFFAPSTGPVVGSMMPSDAPSFVPSSIPTAIPAMPAMPATSVKIFRNSPTSDTRSTPPSTSPSARPSPSAHPSDHPSEHPSAHPSDQQPTAITASDIPTATSTAVKEFRAALPASDSPSTRPSASPSARPSIQDNDLPSAQPTDHPSNTASTFPSTPPSVRPSTLHSAHPSAQPSAHPTAHPTIHPTNQPIGRSIIRQKRPTWQPSQLPSDQPSLVPSLDPTDVF